jgi:hypothetical protein
VVTVLEAVRANHPRLDARRHRNPFAYGPRNPAPMHLQRHGVVDRFGCGRAGGSIW